jgi:hypothetical protein
MANMAEAFRNSKSNAAKGLCNDPVEGDPQQLFQKGITKTVLAAHGEMRTYENMLSCHLLKSVECSENPVKISEIGEPM